MILQFLGIRHNLNIESGPWNEKKKIQVNDTTVVTSLNTVGW